MTVTITGAANAAISATFALEAQQYLERGDAATAIALCNQGLSLYPQYVTAYLILARALLSIGDYTAADHAIERGIQSAPRLSGLGSSFGSLRKKFLAQKTLAQKAKNAVPPAENTAAVSSVEAAAQEAASALRSVEELVEEPAQTFAQARVQESIQGLVQESITTTTVHATNHAASAEQSVTAVTEKAQENESHAAKPATTTAKTGAEYTESTDDARTIGGYLRLIETSSLPTHDSTLRSTNVRLIPGLEFTTLRIESSAFAGTSAPRRRHTLPELPEPALEKDESVDELLSKNLIDDELIDDELTDNGLTDEKRRAGDSTTTHAGRHQETGNTSDVGNAGGASFSSQRRALPAEITGLATVARFRVSDIEHSYPHAVSDEQHDSVGDELDDLARRLSKAQMPPAEELLERDSAFMVAIETEDTPVTAAPMASETMAKIYQLQGAWNLALQAYQALADATDDIAKRSGYLLKAQDCRNKLDTQ